MLICAMSDAATGATPVSLVILPKSISTKKKSFFFEKKGKTVILKQKTFPVFFFHHSTIARLCFCTRQKN